MSTVTLTWAEVASGIHAAGMRRIYNLRNGRQPIYGEPHDPWAADVEGALAEMAVAKHMDRYWSPASSQAPHTIPGDVGPLQVRSTTRPNGCLILHPNDPDEAVFWLVTGSAPTYTLAGWIRGADGKLEQYWREDTGRPAFFVPQTALNAR